MATIMAVDDAYSMRGLVQGILEGEGYDVVTAEDGVEALKLARKQHIDMAVVDVHMPNMNGISLVSKLRRLAEYKTMPILMLTTESSEYRKNKARELGASGWLTKPFDPPRLIKAVNKLMG